jgi:cytochrome P450
MSQTLPQPLFDPFAPGFADDPYPQYAALRAVAPVYQHPFGFWLLTCYEEVSWLLRASLSVEDRNIAASPLLERREQAYGEQAARRRGLSMLDRDPPDHTRLRRHHCLGASLARLEAQVALGRLTSRFPALALDGPVAWNGRINLRGPARLPVSLGT